MGCLYLNRLPSQSTWLCNSGQFLSEGHLIIVLKDAGQVYILTARLLQVALVKHLM